MIQTELVGFIHISLLWNVFAPVKIKIYNGKLKLGYLSATSDEGMKLRIVIASPPKTGNVWVKNLLAEIYDLNIFAGPKPSPEELKKFFTTEIFQDNSIFHEHW